MFTNPTISNKKERRGNNKHKTQDKQRTPFSYHIYKFQNSYFVYFVYLHILSLLDLLFSHPLKRYLHIYDNKKVKYDIGIKVLLPPTCILRNSPFHGPFRMISSFIYSIIFAWPRAQRSRNSFLMSCLKTLLASSPS